MTKDSIVEEVRKNRQKIFNECNNDLDIYFARLKKAVEDFKKESAGILAVKHNKQRRKKAA